MSGYAFCIIVDGLVVHSKVHHKRLPSSYHAEMHAFNMLLRFIRQYLNPGSLIEIYGDHKGLIDMMHSEKQLKNFNKTKELFIKLKSMFTLSLQHIPKKENKIAHKLSRQEFVPLLKPAEIKSLYGEDRLFDERISMSIDDIRIPNYIKYSRLPRYEKYIPRLLYYQKFGRDYKTIRVDPNGFLCEGYITYLILKEHGVNTCNVDVIQAKAS